MTDVQKQNLEEANRIVLVIQGGIGRNIQSTAVIKELKKRYPSKHIAVICGSPELFVKNPHISRIHNLAHPSHFFEDYIKDNLTVVINVEPYQHFDYIYRRRHFINCWLDMLGFEDQESDIPTPEIFYNQAEIEMAKDYLRKFDRRMVLFQHQGGKIPETQEKKSKLIAKTGMYRRNLPENVAQEVTDKLIEKGYMVGSVGHPNQYLPRGAEQVGFPIRAICALIPFVEAVITIDSFLLHGSACYKGKTPTLAIWGGTNPAVLGYPWHKNMTREVCDTPMCHRPNSYLWDFEETGFLWDCPHNDICMNYKASDIIQEFDKMMEAKNGSRKPDSGKKPRGETKEEDNARPEAGRACPCEGSLAKEIPAGVGAN